MRLKLRAAAKSRRTASTARRAGRIVAKRKGPRVSKPKVSARPKTVKTARSAVARPAAKISGKIPKRPTHEPAPKPIEDLTEPTHEALEDLEAVEEGSLAEQRRPMLPQFVDERPRHKIGEHVVYPGVGVCEVTQIAKFGDDDKNFYYLRVLSDRARILLPVGNAPRVGLRPIISAKEATAVYAVLKNQVNKKIKDWKKRQALITEKVASGDPLKAAEVYKRLFFLSKTKGLSHGENVAFVKVRTILADELSLISGVTKDAMIAKIDKILEASYKKRGGMEADEEEE